MEQNQGNDQKNEVRGPTGPSEGQYRPGQPNPQANYNYHYYPQWSYGYSGWYNQQAGYKPPARRSRKPAIVGALLIITGIISMISGVAIGTIALGTGPMWDMMESNTHMSGDSLMTVQGQVIHINSTPVAGVNITIVDLNMIGITNATGHYKILNVEQGWHDLKVEFPGYKTLVKSVEVVKLNMNMYNGSGNPTIKNSIVEDFQLQPGTGELRIGKAHEPGESENDFERNVAPMLKSLGSICLVLGIISGTVMIVAGYFAIKRQKLPIVVVGCVFAIITSALFGIIALVLLLMSTNEFDRKREDDQCCDEDHGKGGHGGPGAPPDHKDHRPAPVPSHMDAPTTRAPDKTQYMAGQIPPYQAYPGQPSPWAPRTY